MSRVIVLVHRLSIYTPSSRGSPNQDLTSSYFNTPVSEEVTKILKQTGIFSLERKKR